MGDSGKKKASSASDLKENIVKLRFDGEKRSVNCFADEIDKKGMTLLCPFPSLKLDTAVEIQASAGPDNRVRSARLRKVGVRYDQEFDMPRMSLRVDMVDENEGGDWITGDIFEQEEEDPPWMMEQGDILSPEVIMKSLPSKKSRWLNIMISAIAILLAFGFGSWSVLRANILDIDAVHAWITGRDIVRIKSKSSVSTMALAEEASPVTSETSVKNTDPLIEEASAGFPVPYPSRGVPFIKGSATGSGNLTSNAENSPEAESEEENIDEKSTADQHDLNADEEVYAENSTGVLSDEEYNSHEAEDENHGPNIILKTKWPVEYAKTYRLKNPSGVVVEIPGAISPHRDGPIKINHPNVSLARVWHVEGGVRYVLYTEGEDLPRYSVDYGPRGVILKIFYEEETQAS